MALAKVKTWSAETLTAGDLNAEFDNILNYLNTGVLDLAGGGIKFPATVIPSSDPNTLDDYEEGSWTPVVQFGGASTGITYGTQLGKYTKIGNLVTINGTIVLTSKGSSVGNAQVTGLPFTCGTVSCAVAVFSDVLAAGTTTTVQGLIVAASTAMTPYRYAAGAVTQLADTSFSATSVINFSGVYFL